MAVLIPPPCEITTDLAHDAPARYVQRVNRDGLGIIIACDAPYYCRSWPQTEPIPPRWVEASTDPVTLDTLDTSVCDLSTVEIEVPPYLDGAVRVVSPRAARPPRVPRARRPPRPPRPRRSRRTARRERTPRKPREPREPRDPRSGRTVARLGRGWAGWPQAHMEAIGIGSTDPGPLPRGDWTCVVDYLDRMSNWSELVVSIGDDEKVCTYLRLRFGDSGVCIGGPATLCQQFADNLAQIIQTINTMVQGKLPENLPAKRRPGFAPRRPPPARPPTPGTPPPTETLEPPPEPIIGTEGWWAFGATASATWNGVKTNKCIAVRPNDHPNNHGGGGLWQRLPTGYEVFCEQIG